MYQKKFWMKVRGSYWFVPLLYGITSILLVIGSMFADKWIIGSFKDSLPSILLTNSGIAKELYGSLVTAILTMTTISFSVIMVVLTTYSTQFSPRTLQDFMRSKMTHHVLGVYCFGFIYALLNLVLAGKENTFLGPIFMVFIAITSLAFFIYFIHHSARWLQVNNLVGKLRKDATRVIRDTFKESHFPENEKWDSEEIKKIKQTNMETIYAMNPGYVQHVEWTELIKWAIKKDCVIEVQVNTGDFLPEGYPIMHVYQVDKKINKKEINHLLVVGQERTDIQDAEFMLQKLVEISLKAISPAMNDPHTAINCINRIGTALADIGRHYKEINYFSDQEGQLRIMRTPKKFEGYLYKSFYQIMNYGKDDVSILYSLIEVLYNLALVSDLNIKRKIWDFHFYIIEGINWDCLHEMDRNHLSHIYDKFKACCNMEKTT
ncbi:DUF2254 domain-containing protein [Virgibacillus halodenitrificans]|uniref:DUF2254 domain-containing protein n=1 Tax=Virgibacillus halodenitrificans TaxID=1482 RepID=UPI002DBD4F64|nr:DUF2254 domain-containing protein [Virgibacillus halodenitrificans]MEC2159184.1 DUF2254 domain-containing protein [Virgibacillus halodenitrificans]